tara:strand:- start:312 stop:1187 length:876 start_codon:yes stop_codon:yes gene_type:complete
MAKKVRGHRANKPNDSFGTINNDGLYKGKYREDVYLDDDEENVEEQQAQPEEEEQTEPSFVQGEAEVKHDYKKRYDDLKRHYDEKVQEFKDKEKQLEATLTEATRSQGISLPKTEEELVKFKEEFPDVYDVVETIATMKAGERAQILEQELETIREKEQNTRVQAAYQELMNSHPDFNEIRQDEKFLGWLEEQPPSISDGILKNNTDARWASRVIDLYKADVNITPKRTKKKKEDAAVSVGAAKARDLTDLRTEGRVFKASDIAKMKPWEFEKLEGEIDSARAEGRIDYNS